MNAALAGLREAWRALGRSPGFVIAVVLLLAVGIGLNDAIFTVVDDVLLRPVGFASPDRLVELESRSLQRNHLGDWIGGDDYTDVIRSVHGLQSAAYYSNYGPIGIEVGGHAVYERMTAVSPAFGAVLGVQPLAGRLFDPTDTAGTGALLSAGLARRQFGSVAAALGKTVRVAGMNRVVVGILPATFSFPERTQLWIELPPAPVIGSRSSGNQRAIARRRSEVSAAALTAELATFSRSLAATYPEDRDKRLEAVPLQDELVGQVRPTLRLLMGAAGVVLLIVCVNVTHLQLARGTRRLHSAAVRTALGATRGHLARMALAETLLLALGGAVAAGLLALPALRGLLQLAPPDMPRLAEIRPDAAVFGWSVLASATLMTLTAIVPLLRAWRNDPATVLRRDNGRGLEGRGAHQVRSALLVAEVAFTVLLAVTAMVFALRLFAAAREDVGFAASTLLTVDAHLTGLPAFPDPPHTLTPETQQRYMAEALGIAQIWQGKLDTVLTELRGVPGVANVAAMEGAPMGFGAVDVSYAIAGRSELSAARTDLPVGYVHAVTPDLFQTMGMPLERGRNFTAADKLGSPLVVVISAALARQQFSGQDPIGQRVRCGYDYVAGWWTVVGVVGDIHADAPGAAPLPTMYVPLAQHSEKSSDLQLVVAARGDVGALLPALAQHVGRSFPQMAVELSTMRDNMAATERMDRLRTVLFSSFGAISLLLAVAGIYGVTSYLVAQQRFTLGLRFAHGVTRGDVLRGVLGRSLSATAAGIVLGVALALFVPRLLASVLGPVPALAPFALLTPCALLLLVSLLATLGPALRAASIEPAETLREA